MIEINLNYINTEIIEKIIIMKSVNEYKTENYLINVNKIKLNRK